MAVKNKKTFESFKGKGPGLTKKKTTKKVAKKKDKIVCPECGGKLFLKRDAIISYPLDGLKVKPPLLKRDDIAELDNNWLECDCGEISHDTDGCTDNEALAEIYDKLKW
jgi:hypothetical protein